MGSSPCRHKEIESSRCCSLFLGADDGTWTHMNLHSLEPESSASANSARSAYVCQAGDPRWLLEYNSTATAQMQRIFLFVRSELLIEFVFFDFFRDRDRILTGETAVTEPDGGLLRDLMGRLYRQVSQCVHSDLSGEVIQNSHTNLWREQGELQQHHWFHKGAASKWGMVSKNN